MKDAQTADYIENLKYENRRMSEFLNRLGYSNEAISEIIINSSEMIIIKNM